MKIPNVKRCVSGLMAAMMVLTSCGTSTPVFADELEYPPLQSVIDQLDADEIRPPERLHCSRRSGVQRKYRFFKP